MSTDAKPRCEGCQYFIGEAAQLEAMLPGLRTLSSAYGSVRSADGLCQLHERYVAASSRCQAYLTRADRSANLSG